MHQKIPLLLMVPDHCSSFLFIIFFLGDVFIKNNIAINANGVAMRNNPKTFTLEYKELEIGDTIGRGCSSVVLQGFHKPTGTPLALKVINLFDKSKRDQLIREISTLYDAQCPRSATLPLPSRVLSSNYSIA
jgi:hypothetical protein